MAFPIILPPRPNYGIDAPKVVLCFLVVGTSSLILGVAAALLSGKGILPWARFVVGPCLAIGVTFLLQAAVMVWGSRIGKLGLRDKIIRAIPWRGDERVLDVGCGHGLMLIGAAKELQTGKAIGIDLWQAEDQAGNSREATRRNVELEQMGGRVELQDGDARRLPFQDNLFDVVLSSWALHNIYDQTGRDAAVREIVRVLKPGGRLAIIDIRHTSEYARVMEESRMTDIRRIGPNFLFLIPSFILTAKKPKAD
jgi:arsenite methyltransferase